MKFYEQASAISPLYKVLGLLTLSRAGFYCWQPLLWPNFRGLPLPRPSGEYAIASFILEQVSLLLTGTFLVIQTKFLLRSPLSTYTLLARHWFLEFGQMNIAPICVWPQGRRVKYVSGLSHPQTIAAASIWSGESFKFLAPRARGNARIYFLSLSGLLAGDWRSKNKRRFWVMDQCNNNVRGDDGKTAYTRGREQKREMFSRASLTKISFSSALSGHPCTPVLFFLSTRRALQIAAEKGIDGSHSN